MYNKYDFMSKDIDNDKSLTFMEESV